MSLSESKSESDFSRDGEKLKKMGLELEEENFVDHTLFVAAVSVGNVGQLATDLLLANLNGGSAPIKVGQFFHPALEAVVGSDVDFQQISGTAAPGLMTSCEMFLFKESKYVIIQFHAPVAMKGRQDFVDSLINYIVEKKFKQVVCFSSIFASDRIDHQLVGIPFRYLSTDSTPSKLTDKLLELEWKSLEKREFPAPAVLDASKSDAINDVGIVHLPGSGITKHLYESCQDQKIPFLALIMFASEGDNTPEALTLFQMADKVFGFRPSSDSNDDSPRGDKLVVPISWTSFREESHPSLY